MHHGPSDYLVAPLLLLVQQFLLRLVQGQFRPYSGNIDARDLRKSLHDESTLVGTFHLNFEQQSDANNLVSRED